MELRQLRAFVEVANGGHFGQAAKRLHLTQPSLTQRIQALEQELGVQLLERSAREVSLTPAGALLLPYAQGLVQVEDEARRKLRDYSTGVAGRLWIAYRTEAEDISMVGSIIGEYRGRFPNVDVQTSAASSGENLQRLLEHNVDVAFALVPASHPAGIEAKSIRRDEIVVAVRSDHHLAHLDRIPVEALRGEPIALPRAPINPDTVNALARWLVSRTGAELNVVFDDPTELAFETVAKSGAAATLVPRLYAELHAADCLAFRSLSPAPLLDLAVAYRTGDPSPTVANMLRVVDEVVPFDPAAILEGGELI
ncbi:MAG: LysR family transcriptional regulator [Candidatus Dormibacteraceae bacterium]